MARTGITRRTSIALAVGAAAAPEFATAAGPSKTKMGGTWAMVDATAAKLVRDQLTPGLSISVRQRGKFVYSKGFGLANLETQTATTPASVYLIGSITKQFTAASLMRLAEAGKLSIDDPLSKYLPDFPRAGEITLRQMLAHTSGLGDYTYTNSPDRGPFLRAARLDYDSNALYRAMLASDPLYAHPPGTVWDYSNLAYVLLGLVVEKQSGMAYDVYVRDQLIARAGLHNTAVDDAANVVRNRASGYAWHEDQPGFWDNASFISRSFAGAAGAMRSTPIDLCLWHEALFSGKVVSPASLKDMITPARLKTGQLPKTTPAAGSRAAPTAVEYGLGLEIATVDGRQTVGHHGSINGYTSSLLTFPAEGVSIAISANAQNGPRYKEAEDTIRAAVVAAAVQADDRQRKHITY